MSEDDFLGIVATGLGIIIFMFMLIEDLPDDKD